MTENKIQLSKYVVHNTNILLALLSVTVLLAGCSAQSQTRVPEIRKTSAQTPIQVVQVFDVQPTPNPTNGDRLIPAALSAEDTAIVLAELEGRLVSVSEEEGSRVAKGDVLAQFSNQEQQLRIRQVELDISRLKVEAQQSQATIKLNRSELDRELLLASQGLVSKGEVERAQYKLDQSVQEYEKMRLATESAASKLEVLKLDLQKTIVRAPVTGVITRRYISPGTNVVRNDKLFEVAQLSRIELRFRVPQTSESLPECGEVLGVSIEEQGRVIAKARIRRRDPIADPLSNTFGYVADIVGSANLIPGLTVYVHLPREGGGSFWLPLAAFPIGSDVKNGDPNTVFIVKGDRVFSRGVVVKAIEGDQVEVESGLMKDDRVVLAPWAGLKDGDQVTVGQ